VVVKVSKIALGFTCRLVKACSTATPVSDKLECMILSCIPNVEVPQSKLPALIRKRNHFIKTQWGTTI
jgi:hypothetical protein